MAREDLIDAILYNEPAFTYNGRNCLINLNGDHIHVWYGNQPDSPMYNAKDIEDALSYPLFDGKSLNDICEEVEFW